MNQEPVLVVDSFSYNDEWEEMLWPLVLVETCPICLEPFRDRARLEICLHSFCFSCIVSWSRIIKGCPLCKQSFTYVIHHIVSDRNFSKVTRRESVYWLKVFRVSILRRCLVSIRITYPEAFAEFSILCYFFLSRKTKENLYTTMAREISGNTRLRT
jgi:hypothetical protein